MSNRAWVTLATNDSYGLGALVLANSLRRVGSVYPSVVLITPSVTEAMRNRLQAVFAEVVTVDVLDSRDAAHLALLQRPELGITFTKIHCWSLSQYEKCVFLDADTLVVQNCDELFEREELSAAPDVGWPDCFNTGVFVYRPSQETFEKLIKFAQERGSFDGGDQGLLNSFFSDWAHGDINKHLPFLYNVTSAAFYSYLPALKHYGQNLKIIHFIGATKPWLQRFNWETRTVEAQDHLRELLQLWWDLFVGRVHPQLDTTMSGVAGNLARVVPGAVGSQREVLDELTRRQGWEAGNIDYMGADSFANIWAKISQTLNQPRSSPPKQTPPKEPTPPPKQPSPPRKEPTPPKQPSPPKETPQVEIPAGEVNQEPLLIPVAAAAKEEPSVEALATAVLATETSAPAATPAESSAPVETPVPTETAVDLPASVDAQIEIVKPVDTLAPTAAPVEIPTLEPVPVPAAVPAETDAQLQAPVPVEASATKEVSAPVAVEAPATKEVSAPVEALVPVEVPTSPQTLAPTEASTPAQEPALSQVVTPAQVPAPAQAPATEISTSVIALADATAIETPGQVAVPIEASAPVAKPSAPDTAEVGTPKPQSVEPIDEVPSVPLVESSSSPAVSGTELAVEAKEESNVKTETSGVQSSLPEKSQPGSNIIKEKSAPQSQKEVPSKTVVAEIPKASEQTPATPTSPLSTTKESAKPAATEAKPKQPTTPEKPLDVSAKSTASTDSPPLVSTPSKEEIPSSPAAKSEERRKPAGKLQLSPPAAADPLPTPDSELEDAAALAQSIIASELSTPTVTSPSPSASPASPQASKQEKRLSVDEPEVPTPPVGTVSLAQIGVKPAAKGKSTTAAQIESSVSEKKTEPATPTTPTSPATPVTTATPSDPTATEAPKKKVVKKIVKKEAAPSGEASMPVPPPRKKEKKPKEK